MDEARINWICEFGKTFWRMLQEWCFNLPAVDLSESMTIEQGDQGTFRFVFHVALFDSFKTGRASIAPDQVELGEETAHRIFESCLHPLKTSIGSLYLEQNYNNVFSYSFGEPRAPLEDSTAFKCRFCLRSRPEVTFRKVAHAIPECTGNRRLVSNYECDSCNEDFGARLDNEFATWTKVHRALFSVKRKKSGFPKFRWGRDGYVHATREAVMLKPPDFNSFQYDQKMNTMTLSFVLPDVVPITLLRALYKYAFTVVPERMLDHLNTVRSFVMSSDIELPFAPCYAAIFETFQPLAEFSTGNVFLYERTSQNQQVPSLIFVLRFAHLCFQIHLPTDNELKRDELVGVDERQLDFHRIASRKNLTLTSTVASVKI